MRSQKKFPNIGRIPVATWRQHTWAQGGTVLGTLLSKPLASASVGSLGQYRIFPQSRDASFHAPLWHLAASSEFFLMPGITTVVSNAEGGYKMIPHTWLSHLNLTITLQSSRGGLGICLTLELIKLRFWKVQWLVPGVTVYSLVGGDLSLWPPPDTWHHSCLPRAGSHRAQLIRQGTFALEENGGRNGEEAPSFYPSGD